MSLLMEAAEGMGGGRWRSRGEGVDDGVEMVEMVVVMMVLMVEGEGGGEVEVESRSRGVWAEMRTRGVVLR